MKKIPKLDSMILSAVLAGFTILPGSLHAATLTLNGSAQAGATIRNDATNINRNFGADGALIVGTTATPAVIRTALGFSLAEIPAGSTINSITLTIRQNQPDATSLNGDVLIHLHQLTSPFAEGTGSTASTNTNNVTWNNRLTGTAWTTPGGDFSASPLASITANPTAVAGTLYTFTDPAFLAAAQAAIGGDLSLILKLETENTADRRAFFFNADDGLTANSPVLTIDYTVPEASTGLLALAGLGLSLGRRRRP